MSYDISFIPKRPDQSWTEALEQHEERVQAESPDSGRPSAQGDAGWRRVVARVREVAPGLAPLDGDSSPDSSPHSWDELTDPETGVQLSVHAGEVGLSVPYWHEGDQAEVVASQLVAIARIVEEETGLRGHDPQQDGSFLSGPATALEAAHELSRVASLIRGGDVAEVTRRRRPWWRFW